MKIETIWVILMLVLVAGQIWGLRHEIGKELRGMGFRKHYRANRNFFNEVQEDDR